MGLQPNTVTIVHHGGHIMDIPVEQVKVGDVLLVKPGSKIPVDGIVENGESYVVMNYSIGRKTNKSFNEAVNAVTSELKKEGFGIITEIDLKDKFKEKLGVEFRNYKILGACNPAMAHKAIQIEDRIGVMLPCNVLVQEKENGEVEVSAINPLSSIGVVENEGLKSIAAEIGEKLQKVVNNL